MTQFLIHGSRIFLLMMDTGKLPTSSSTSINYCLLLLLLLPLDKISVNLRAAYIHSKPEIQTKTSKFIVRLHMAVAYTGAFTIIYNTQTILTVYTNTILTGNMSVLMKSAGSHHLKFHRRPKQVIFPTN